MLRLQIVCLGHSYLEFSSLSNNNSNTNHLILLVSIRCYIAITELDETVLNRLIIRILIGKFKKVGEYKTQDV